MDQFLPLTTYFLVAIAVCAAALLASLLFPSVRSSPTKFLPYESGIQTQTDLFHQRISLRYSLVALLFLAFDVEVIFLYPWAVVAKTLGPFAFYEMSFFLVCALVGFFYAWSQGAFSWE